MTAHSSQEHQALINFKQQYESTLEKFLLNTESSEILDQATTLSKSALDQNISFLDITKIHLDWITVFMSEKTDIKNLFVFFEKANLWLQTILVHYKTIPEEYFNLIFLFQQNNLNLFFRIHHVKEILVQEQKKRILLEKEKEKYQSLLNQLQTLLNDKESLFKEVYHRFKNNMQIITSIIGLQLDTLQEEKAKQALICSGSRIKTMALVHEMLYQAKNLSEIAMHEYIQKLVNYLYEIYCVDKNKIQCSLLSDNILLNVDKAVSLGLMINEILSNAFKHAFPNNKIGKIDIKLKELNDSIELLIRDNGIGIPSLIDPTNTNTLGMRLIYNLAKQLNGKINLDRNTGTQIAIILSKIPMELK